MRILLKIIAVLILVLITVGAVVSCSMAPAKPSAEQQAQIEQSPNWRDGKFYNELPRYSGSVWEMLLSGLNNANHYTTPRQPLPVIERQRSDFEPLPGSGLRVTWLGHSTVLVEIDGYRLLTDPMWGERASPFSFVGPKRFFAPPLSLEQLPKLDAVLISHDHFDHLDEETIRALKQQVNYFLVPLGVGAHLQAWGVEPNRIVERDWWGEFKLGELTLVATPARHFSGRSLTTVYLDETLWSGWAMLGPQHRVYYSGDTGMFSGFKQIGERLGPFDLSMIEVGAYNRLWPDVHIGPEQALQAHRLVGGKALLPLHWATFDLAQHNWTEPGERLLAATTISGENLLLPRPGESLDPTAPPPAKRWWPKRPWQSAAESPLVSTGLEASPVD